MMDPEYQRQELHAGRRGIECPVLENEGPRILWAPEQALHYSRIGYGPEHGFVTSFCGRCPSPHASVPIPLCRYHCNPWRNVIQKPTIYSLHAFPRIYPAHAGVIRARQCCLYIFFSRTYNHICRPKKEDERVVQDRTGSLTPFLQLLPIRPFARI
jgi:hypothetical protein